MVDLEKHADLLRVAQVEVMPGLAQCAAYVRAMFTGYASDEITAKDMIQVRFARQETLVKAESPEYRVVMSSRACAASSVGRRSCVNSSIT